MHRVLVTGNAGSGKSTVAAAMASILKLPFSGMDEIVWQPGWVKTPSAVRNAKESTIAAGSDWIVDGVSAIFLEAADTVVFLDYPRYKCYWRAFRRNLPFLFRSRPGLPVGCPELLVIPTLAKIIWRFPKRVRPSIFKVGHQSGKSFVHVRNNSELRQFLDTLPAPWPNPSVNADVPNTFVLPANRGGGTPVTLYR